jgi:hypothetical protein
LRGVDLCAQLHQAAVQRFTQRRQLGLAGAIHGVSGVKASNNGSVSKFRERRRQHRTLTHINARSSIDIATRGTGV